MADMLGSRVTSWVVPALIADPVDNGVGRQGRCVTWKAGTH
jgi:hypothetical protein